MKTSNENSFSQKQQNNQEPIKNESDSNLTFSSNIELKTVKENQFSNTQLNIESSSCDNSTNFDSEEIGGNPIEKDSGIIVNMSEENEDNNFGNIFAKKPCRIGNTYTCLWYHGEPLIVIGPHWPFFLCLNSIIMSISITYFFFLWNSLYPTARNIGFAIFIFQNFCYWYTALVNPGIPIKHHISYINLNNNSPENSVVMSNNDINNNKHPMEIGSLRKIKKVSKKTENTRVCRTCNIIIDLELDMVHCDECDVCIEGHDHHCPWTSKCIGKNNLQTFYGFVFGTLALFFFLIFGLVFIKPSH